MVGQKGFWDGEERLKKLGSGLKPEDESGCQEDGREEDRCTAVVASGTASPVLELGKQVLTLWRSLYSLLL